MGMYRLPHSWCSQCISWHDSALFLCKKWHQWMTERRVSSAGSCVFLAPEIYSVRRLNFRNPKAHCHRTTPSSTWRSTTAQGRVQKSLCVSTSRDAQPAWTIQDALSKVDEGGISEGQNKEEYHGTRPELLWSVGMHFHGNCLMKEKYSNLS